jgi:hypothetical protein
MRSAYLRLTAKELSRKMNFKSYQVKVDHRNTSKLAEKSQWTVNEWTELHLFSMAVQNEWVCSKGFLWSLLSNDGTLQKIGYDKANDELYLSKFRSDQQHQWHGYPIHPRHDDIPPKTVTNDWRNKSLISNVTANRITQGKL